MASWHDECIERICGFANAQGGVLEVGRDVRGNVASGNNLRRLLDAIPYEVKSELGIVVDVNLKTEDGAEYLEVMVGSYPHPVSFRGEYHYRSPSTTQVLRGSALRQFLSRGLHGRQTEVPTVEPGNGSKASSPTQEPVPTTQEQANCATQEQAGTTQEQAGTTQEQAETTQETTFTTQEQAGTTQEILATTQEPEAEAVLTTTRERILALLKADPRTTRRLMAQQIGITPDGVKYHLAKLRKAGMIRHVGPTKAGRWEVLK